MPVSAPPNNTNTKNQISPGAQVVITLTVEAFIAIFIWALPTELSQEQKYIILADSAVLAAIIIVCILIKTKIQKQTPLLPLFTTAIVIVCIAVSMSVWPLPPEPTTTIPALVSDTGVMLELPKDTEYVETPEVMHVNPVKTDSNRIFLMPRPKSGNGHLINERKDPIYVYDGEDVTILARSDIFCFFKTAEGYYGWNNEDYFTP